MNDSSKLLNSIPDTMITMRIPLTQGKEAIIDEVDSDLLIEKWYAIKQNSITYERYYAARHNSRKSGHRITIRMHRVILERKLGRILKINEQCDHINNDGLDNRRKNLRVATNQQNCQNQRQPNKIKSSQYKGVSWHDARWEPHIKVSGSQIYLGRFIDEIDAAKAYDKAARLYFKEFAKLNFPNADEM